MEYLTALDAIIDRGIAAAKRDYAHKPGKLRGAVAGFEACRNRTPTQLKELLEDAARNTRTARMLSQDHNDEELEGSYWAVRCYEAEVDWVCNCVSVLLARKGLPTIVPPTDRAALTVASIVGVAAPD